MLVSVFLASVLVTVVSSQQAEFAAVPITVKPTIQPPDICRPILKEAVDEDDILVQLNSGELGAEASQSADSLTIYRRRCEDGPVNVIHTVPNEFHWPPIYRGSCDNLFCKDPPCFARRKVWRTKCVFVFKKINGYWVKIGFRSRRFLDHVTCGCKQCTDIRERKSCINTKPCPNSNNPKSFCYWIPLNIWPPPPVLQADTSAAADAAAPAAGDLVAKPVPILPTIKPTIYPLPLGRCACCTPIYCRPPKFFNEYTCRCECPRIRCPPGRIFNSITCKCDCPPGSKLNSDGQCVGDCKDISELYCRFTYCKDNPHLLCNVENWKCKCPSCEAAKEPLWCSKTKCLEQPSKPHCVTDPYSKKCRCPRCEDQTEHAWCRKTYCGPYNNIRCKWEYAWNKCFCPKH